MSGPHLRQATAADIPGIWEVRYSVTENTLTPGRISDEEVRESIEDTGCGWGSSKKLEGLRHSP
jgi:hypothetical protein